CFACCSESLHSGGKSEEAEAELPPLLEPRHYQQEAQLSAAALEEGVTYLLPDRFTLPGLFRTKDIYYGVDWSNLGHLDVVGESGNRRHMLQVRNERVEQIEYFADIAAVRSALEGLETVPNAINWELPP